MAGTTLRGSRLLIGALAAWFAAPAVSADQITDFYRGKTVTFIIGSGEAGSYDLGGRLIARYLSKYIPGNPTLVPQNMPGASSVRAASYINSVAARDGSLLGTAQPTIILNKLLDPAAKYEPEKYTWIGRLQPMTLVGIAWKAAPDHTMEDAKSRKLIVGASGASGTSAIVPWALNRLIGTHFQVVTGYASAVPQLLAMERGELEGVGSESLNDVLARRDWIDNGKVSFLYTIATRRSSQLPDVPAIVEFAQNDRTAILRAAFLKMAKDPDFLAEAGKIGLNPEPLSGEDLQKVVAETLSATGAAVQKLRDVTQPPQ
jgi:tripartite-type tricarboxylate transporter receptor subunit TctC